MKKKAIHEHASSFLYADGATPRLWSLRKLKHFNGMCACYVPKGQGINGTRESGKSCKFSELSGQQQRMITAYAYGGTYRIV